MTNNPSVVNRLIRQLSLQPHPEGGLFRQTYCSKERVLRANADEIRAARHASTAIYYMLCGSDYSAWHRIDVDEIWHFYMGDPIFLHVLSPLGEISSYILSNPIEQPDGTFQVCVPAGHWFAAERTGPRGYSLAGCTVAPGFEFEHFELADIVTLQALYPRHRDLLQRLAPGKTTAPDKPPQASPPPTELKRSRALAPS